MEKFEKDIKVSINMIENRSSYYDMTEYSRIYYNITENIKEYNKFIKGNYTKALLPTSSGDQIIENVLNGITNIISYDLNRLAKYFVEFKIAVLKNNNIKDFIKIMYDPNMTLTILSSIRNDISDECYYFWNYLLKKYKSSTIIYGLIRDLGIKVDDKLIRGFDLYKYMKDNYISYLTKGNYEKVQKNLNATRIEYINENILNIKDKLCDKTFDLIDLSNIYEYINVDAKSKDARIFGKVIFDLINILDPNGKLLVSYLYNSNIKDLMKYYKLDPDTYYLYLTILYDFVWLRIRHDDFAYKHDKKSVIDKLYAFRNSLILNFTKGINLDMYEVEKTYLGKGKGDKDLVLIYEKIEKI